MALGIYKEFKRYTTLYLQMVAFFFSKSPCFPLPWFVFVSFLLFFCCFLLNFDQTILINDVAGYGMECSRFMRGNKCFIF